jgi:hypothetical protein
MTLDPNQQAELDHLILWMQDCPTCREYATWKAKYRAAKDPSYWGWLPSLLAAAVTSATTQNASSSRTHDAPPETV